MLIFLAWVAVVAVSVLLLTATAAVVHRVCYRLVCVVCRGGGHPSEYPRPDRYSGTTMCPRHRGHVLRAAHAEQQARAVEQDYDRHRLHDQQVRIDARSAELDTFRAELVQALRIPLPVRDTERTRP